MSDARYPALCRVRDYTGVADPIFAVGGLRGGYPAVALGETDGSRRVVVSALGAVAAVRADQVTLGLGLESALAIMDALEEAIEDVRDDDDAPRDRLAALEATLALFDNCVDEP